MYGSALNVDGESWINFSVPWSTLASLSYSTVCRELYRFYFSLHGPKLNNVMNMVYSFWFIISITKLGFHCFSILWSVWWQFRIRLYFLMFLVYAFSVLEEHIIYIIYMRTADFWGVGRIMNNVLKVYRKSNGDKFYHCC